MSSTKKPKYKAKSTAITFGSFKRVEDKQEAEKNKFISLREERRQREHEAELERIDEAAKIQRAVEEEHERVIKEQNTIKKK